MSWAEFRIRLFAFKRIERNKLELIRVHSYHTATGGLYSMNPKLFPKTLNKFWKVEDEIDNDKRMKRLEALRQKQIEVSKSKTNG